MRITTADHVNLHVKDPEATLAFYQGVLGLQPERLDDFRAGKRPLFAFRVSQEFIIHVFPDAGYDRLPRGYDHLALAVEGTSPQELIAYLEEHGVPIEPQLDNL